MKRLCGAVFALLLAVVCIFCASAEGEYSYTQKDGKITIKSYNGDAEEVVIPDEIDGMPVVKLGQFAFFNKPNLKKVTVPESVQIIDSHCFLDSENLETVIIPETVETLGKFAFNNTAFFNNPSNWTDGALYLSNYLLCVDKSYEGRFVIKDGTRVIVKYAFAGCDLIDGIEIPESVTVIPVELFVCEEDDIVPVYYVYEGTVADSVVTKRGFKKEYLYRNPVGWLKINSDWYYYADGEPLTDWFEYEDSLYYFSSDGKMQTGWVKLGGNWYFFNTETGKMVTGWQRSPGNKKMYCLSSDGKMLTGWQKIENKWYYLGTDGAMQTGWVKSPGNKKWYFLGENGAMVTGWIKSPGNKKWYLLGTDGAMLTGWQVSPGNKKWYYLGTDGAMQTGWVKSPGNKKWYYLGTDGAMRTGWVQSPGNKRWYYLGTNGAMQTGWVKSPGNKKWYYLDSWGRMVTGSCVINGKMYYFAPDGKWNENKNEKTVYITKSGKKYHYSNKCGNYSFSAISLSEAKAKGYTPCSRCS